MESNRSKFESRFLILGFFEECRKGACGLGNKGYFVGEVLLALTAVWGENSQPMLHSISICTCARSQQVGASSAKKSHDFIKRRQDWAATELASASRYILTSPFSQSHKVLILSQDLTYWKLINSKVGFHCVDEVPRCRKKAPCLLRPWTCDLA